jgi:hypothetical protein
MQRDPAFWSSASSPEAGEDPANVESYLLKLSGDSAKTPGATAKGSRAPLPCGFMCHGKEKSGRGGNCRKMIQNHKRGAVCPECMDESLFLQCSEGCLSYVHVGCADSAHHWTCDKCSAKREEAVESLNASSEAEEPEQETIETMHFENYNECHCHLRDNHFVVKKKRYNFRKELTHVDYKCEGLKCNAKFSVKRKGESEIWQAPLFVAHQVGLTSYLQCLYKHH